MTKATQLEIKIEELNEIEKMMEELKASQNGMIFFPAIVMSTESVAWEKDN